MKKIFAMMTLITIFVSCQRGGEDPVEPTQKRVTISPTITRATELSFEQGDKVGLTIIRDDQSKHADNALMSYTDGTFSGNTTWYDGTSKSKMVAYYPYSDTGAPTKFTISADQTTGYSTSDLMAAVESDVIPSGSAVAMSFRHLLSKVIVNVKQSDAGVSSVVLKNSIPTAVLDLENMTVSADQSAPVGDVKAQAVTENLIYRAILVPQTTDLTVVVTTTQGKVMTKRLSRETIKSGGQYSVNIEISTGQLKVSMSGDIENWTNEGELGVGTGDIINPTPEGATAYVTRVLDYMPAVGQLTNKQPLYVDGDNQQTMNAKVLAEIGNNKRGLISLGGFGGYVVVGFDHTIANVAGKRDFRVIGNAFYSNLNAENPDGGSCEPGVIMVAYDFNKNGVPDEDEWCEIAGSAHQDPTKEPWYERALNRGNNVNLYRDYRITYHKPQSEPSEEDYSRYIRWEDNKGNSGYKTKNQFHSQCYYPLWAQGDKISFNGTCLPQNGINEGDMSNYFVLYKFLYGYADNEMNSKDDSAIDIAWAVNSRGESVSLPGVDFIKIYTGVNQESGWLGECSTEISGVEDLHVLGVSIDTRN